MPSRASYLLQGTLITTLSSLGAFHVWTKHCDVRPLDPNVEPLYKSSFFRKYNPDNNPTQHDVIIRRIPLHQLKPELLDDAQNGGSKLVEHFTGGIFGSLAYTPQRLIHGRGAPESSLPPPSPDDATQPSRILEEATSASSQPTQQSSWYSGLTSAFSSSSKPTTQSTAHASDPSTTSRTPYPLPAPSGPPENLWSQSALAHSRYPRGSVITNHFLVLSRDPPQTVLLRCGGSPLDTPHGPRSSDGLFEIGARCDFEKGFAEFTLKSLFYNGSPEGKDNKGMPPRMWFLHQQYAKLWMESGVRQCRLSRWRSEEAQKAEWREEKREEKRV